MRREQFDLEISNVDWINGDSDPRLPTLGIHFDGEASTLRDELSKTTDDAESAREPREIDITVRLHGSPDDGKAGGVVAVTDRVTGEYILELHVDADDVLTFITAARRYGEQMDNTARYSVQLSAADGEAGVYEKRTLLVYGDDGELLRQYSLIPSGVEI